MKKLDFIVMQRKTKRENENEHYAMFVYEPIFIENWMSSKMSAYIWKTKRKTPQNYILYPLY